MASNHAFVTPAGSPVRVVGIARSYAFVFTVAIIASHSEIPILTIEPRGIRDEQRMAAQEIRMLSTTKRTRSMVVVAMLMGALLLTAPAMAASSLIVTNQSTNGSVVKVTVKNTSILPVTTMIAVQVQVGGTSTWGYAPVVLLGGQSASVGVGFAGTVTKVLSVGINDECVPI